RRRGERTIGCGDPERFGDVMFEQSVEASPAGLLEHRSEQNEAEVAVDGLASGRLHRVGHQHRGEHLFPRGVSLELRAALVEQRVERLHETSPSRNSSFSIDASSRTFAPSGTGWLSSSWPTGKPSAQGSPVSRASSASTWVEV